MQHHRKMLLPRHSFQNPELAMMAVALPLNSRNSPRESPPSLYSARTLPQWFPVFPKDKCLGEAPQAHTPRL